MSASLRPAFIIGGAPRSGTTYLADGIGRHPQVFMARPLIPEPKVFVGPRQPAQAYEDRYRQLFADAPAGVICGEKTSNYLESTTARELIREHLPEVRLLFIVREPVARAYSNFLWSTRNGLETLSFEEAIAAEGRRESPLPPEKAYARPFDYLARGHYAEFARPYFEAFGPEQVRFFLYEDITLRPQELWQEIQAFLGLSPLPAEALDGGIVNSARDVGGPISQEARLRLRDRMQPAVQDFQTLTGLDLSAWGYAA